MCVLLILSNILFFIFHYKRGGDTMIPLAFFEYISVYYTAKCIIVYTVFKKFIRLVFFFSRKCKRKRSYNTTLSMCFTRISFEKHTQYLHANGNGANISCLIFQSHPLVKYACEGSLALVCCVGWKKRNRLTDDIHIV